MPYPCFSYPADVPPCISNRDAIQHAGYLNCFSYPAELRRMPFARFSYPADVPLGTENRDAAQPDLRRMPTTCCCRY